MNARKVSTRLLSFLLAFYMVFGMLPVTAHAEEAETTVPSVTEQTQPTVPVVETTGAPQTETTDPDTSVPETSVPETTVPDTTVLEVSTADVLVPETTVPVEEPDAVITAESDVEPTAEDGIDDQKDVDYLFVATDRHTNTSIIATMINAMESKIGENELDYLALGGDMVGSGNSHPTYNSSTVLGEVTGATSSLSATNVDIVAGIHDMNVNDDAGIVLPYQGGGAQIFEGDKFYVYGVPESCISGAVSGVDPETEANDFVTWANGSGIDKSKAIIVVSHYPLHVRRNDNNGAVYWAEALNTVAAGDDTAIDRNVAFFWGHNHTGETNADTAVYHVAPNGSISVQGGSSNQTIYFTYANAGYLNAKSSATLITITDDTITFDKYNNSNVSTTNSVDRVVTTPAVTLISIAISGETEYTVGDELELTVTATYSDGTTADVTADATLSGYDMATAGTYTVKAEYEGVTAEYTITVSAAVTEQTFYSEDTFAAVTATAENGTVTDIYDENDTTVNAMFQDAYWRGYSFALEGQVTDTTATITLWLDGAMTSSNLAVYYLNENGKYEAVTGYTVATDDYDVEYITISNAALGTYVYGTPNADDVIPEDATLTRLDITVPEKTKYFLSEDLENGKVYLDITGLSVTAVYTLNNEEYTKTLDWNRFDETVDGYALTFDDLTTKGEKTVTVTYGDVSANFNVWVCEEQVKTEDVTVTFDTESVIALTVATVETNETITTAVADVITGDVTVYSFTPTYANGDTALSGKATVTLPIPNGVTNPVVYYVSDDGATIEKMTTTVNEDGTLTFTTTHFSTYVVGESTEIDVDDPKTATGSGSTTTTEEKEVYVLVSTPTAGNQYIIVSSGVAGSGYALKENTTTGTSVTINAAGNGISAPYIETTDETIMWNTTAGIRFTSVNDGYILRYRSNNNGLRFSTSDTSNSNWTVGQNSAYGNYRYLKYSNSTWTASSGSASVYFYEKQTVEVETTTNVSGTYSIAGKDVTVVVAADGTSTETLSSTLTFTPSDGGSATTTDVSATATYTVVDGGDPSGVISGISGNTVTFSGKYGKALVKVSYTTSFGEVTNYITVEASAPYYTIQLHLNENGTLGEEITAPVALKGIEAGDTYSVWAVVKEHTSANPDGVDLGTLGDALTWSVSDESIATIDTTTGVITFTGNNYGTFEVGVSYTGSDGKFITDRITISATASQYVVPGDGTNDFPEYPNEGAIRFDKTATAVGNFSETGIAKVELSMTGVPYSTGSEIDVVIMLDMTGSMSDTAMAAAEESAIAFAEQIVKNEDGSFNNNRICVMAFNSSSSSPFTYWSMGTISESQWDRFCSAVRGASGDKVSGGTPYDEALEKCQSVLQSAKTDGIGNDRQQFCVFVSDGGPTSYKYITNYDAVKAGTATSYTTASASAQGGANQSDSNFATIATYTHEYYSTLMKDDGVTMFSVLTGLSASSYPNCATILRNIASSSDNAYVVENGSDTTALTGALGDIAKKIVEAAKNVVVEDKIGEDYTLNFSLPTGVTDTETGMSEFYIQVVEYNLDEDKERTGTPTVLENFTFDANGALKTHTVNGTVTCQGTACTHVTTTAGKVTAINGTYFTYTCAPLLDASGAEVKNEVGDTITEEYLTWNAEKLSTTELVLEYFAYLDNSAGYGADKQVPAGTYYTNEYATITYDNYLGNRVQQEFPVPQMTWNGAQVTYVFYLVNEAGQPVNRAGRVIPFAEALYVTNPVTFNVTWNEETGTENILAHDIFAEAGVPDVFALYDEDAQYVIRVYQTETVDTNGKNGNYFQISGSNDKLIDSALDSDSDKDNSTTVVFNTKAGTKYDAYGIYSIYNAGTTLTNGTADITTTVKTDDIDYANTTVAFAVVWKPELVEDTVVVDYGLDVVIDVTTNDAMASGVVGVRTDAPKSGDAEVKINSGTYTSAKNTSVEVSIDGKKIGTAKVENNTSVRFSFDKTNGMQFTDPAVFYYESDVNYYDENSKLQTTSMYSKVTVIPATTVYYEDNFLTLESYTKGNDDTFTKDTTTKWIQEGTTLNKTQDTDRPGEGKISELYDAENKYGYDSAYETMSKYSMGSAAMVHVDASSYATAEFTFYGTGFDVIGLTSNDTGTLAISVKDANNTVVKNLLVDTYYGYTYTDGEWVVTDTDAENPLYQVPVMKVAGLTYGKYSVTITATYAEFFDHTTEAGYDLYLDAIRIYDPVDPDNTTVEDIYKEDGEGWPIYKELRNLVIDAAQTQNLKGISDYSIEGAVFIDGNKKCAEIATYMNYGPNNELYLAPGQGIAFTFKSLPTTLIDIQMAVKSVGGESSVSVFNPGTKTTTETVDGEEKTTTTHTMDNMLTVDVKSATDMYYSILDQAATVKVVKENGKDNVTAVTPKAVVIYNSGNTVISLTNLKFTFSEKYSGEIKLTVNNAVATDAQRSMSFYTNTTVVNTTIEEDDQVEEPKPEVKETEPKVEEPKPEVKETEPKVEEPKPEVKETEPKVEDPKPEVNETEPKVEEPKPEVKETEPKVEEPKPVVKETEPKVEEPKPEVKETEPKVEEPKPEVKETEPKVEDAPIEQAPAENNILNNIRNAINSFFEALFGWLVD